jgi:hypothetical protein
MGCTFLAFFSILSNQFCGVNDCHEGDMDYRQKGQGITVVFVDFFKKGENNVETTVQS